MYGALLFGGLICVIAQILIDKTKITSARILVLFVTVGAILGGLGIYQYLIDFAGAGATVPILRFWCKPCQRCNKRGTRTWITSEHSLEELKQLMVV